MRITLFRVFLFSSNGSFCKDTWFSCQVHRRTPCNSCSICLCCLHRDQRIFRLHENHFSWVSLSVFGLLQQLKVLLPSVYFETSLRDWFWSVWHQSKSGKPQGRQAVLSWRWTRNVLKIWFIPAMIYWEVMDGVVKSKKRPRVKMDFCKKFQLCRGSLVRGTQNQLHVHASCNSMAWDSSSARHKGTAILGVSAQWAGTSAHTEPLCQQTQQCQHTDTGTAAQPSLLIHCWCSALLRKPRSKSTPFPISIVRVSWAS